MTPQETLPRASRLARLSHVALVVGVWGVYSWTGLAYSVGQVGALPSVIGGYILFFIYSTLLSLAFHHLIRSRRWLQLSPWGALLRVLAGITSQAAVQTILVYAIQFVWSGAPSPATSPTFFFLVWLNSGIIGALITALYCTASIFRRMTWVKHQAKELETSANLARLAALEAQMNPHFLFNALNSLRGMIGENPSTAQDMVTRLANILRHSLTRDPGQACRFQEELEMVQDYLSLEGVRFEERLQTAYDIDPSVSTFLIPALSLQTLVENAVKHGISPRPQGGRLELSARRVDLHRWEVRVSNPGQLSSAASGTRVGLRNLRERLQLLHGDEATFTLTDSPAGVVHATLSLPIVSAP